jgi:cyclopropane-fatty-acyl-phospholipid synthase
MSDASISTTTSAAAHSAALLNQIFPPPRAFGIRLWDGTELPAPNPAFWLVLTHPGALRRMFKPPVELSLGEALIYGDLDLEGDLFAALAAMESSALRAPSIGQIFGMARHFLALPRGGLPRPDGRGPAQMHGEPHSKERDRAAIRYHYDVGNDFYGLWLDRNRQYSCGYFSRPDEDLDTAQEHKMEHICRKLRLKPGERLLDIGCGWGGLVQYAARHYGVTALGVTLSEKQADYAKGEIDRAGLADRAEVAFQDYRDLETGQVDKIVSVGMFEHVGRSHLPEYFRTAYRILKPGGLFLNHGISSSVPKARPVDGEGPPHAGLALNRGGPSLWQGLIQRWIVGAGSFVDRYVFPDGELVTVSEANLVAEQAGFEVRDVENLREHYALTLRRWVARLQDQHLQAIRLVGQPTYRVWQLFMSASAYQFEAGAISVNQSLLAKPAAGHADLPLTRADLYTSS